MSGDKNTDVEWNEVITLMPFEQDGDGQITNGMDRFAEAVLSRKPEERVGFALGVIRGLYERREYRKVVKLCDFITIQLIDSGMSVLSAGLSPEVLEVYDARAMALCELEDSLLKEVEKAISLSDAHSFEKLYEQITYTRHRKLWAYSDKLSKKEGAKARLGRAKAYLDLGRPEEARADIEAVKSVRGQKTFNLQLS